MTKTQEGLRMVKRTNLSTEKTLQSVKLDVSNGETFGEAVPVILFTPDHRFLLAEAALESILLRPEIKDRYVVLVSVAGAFRKGKSFMLDFFLRYLKSKYQGNKRRKYDFLLDWMGSEDLPLRGFTWRGGSERETTGILMWSEVFLTTLTGGEEAAIMLLDTQGTFDSKSTVKDCATVFALSTMVSSVQIYNLSQNIQEDDFQHLQLFTEYGKLALAESGQKPFQKLLFLVRDWSFPYEAEYGEIGGQYILERRLEISANQHPELQSIRKHIHSCFSEIGCFLMPHPGLIVARNPDFDGRLSDIDMEFKKYLKVLVPSILAPENLIVKEINGHKVKAKELLQYFKSYVMIYSGDDLPEPKSMLEATAEANNLAAVAEAKEAYNLMMESCCGATKPYLSSGQLESEHMRIKYQALDLFAKKRKMGGEEFSEKYRKKLECDLDEMYEQFKQHNASKNIFNAAKTPSVLFVITLICYVLSGLFGFIGLYKIANAFNLVMGTALATLMAWAYVRYSGEMMGVGMKIDEVSSALWETFMKPCYRVIIEGGIEEVARGATPSSSQKKTN